MQTRTKITAGAAFVVAGLLVVGFVSRSGCSGSPSGGATDDARVRLQADDGAPGPAAPAEPLEPSEVFADSGPRDSGPNALVIARWGSGRGELGRNRPQEGNPEGPMSLVLAGRDLLVLDQVNGRLARYDDKGRLLSTSDAPHTAQDLAVGKDGTVAMVDRLVDKSITLVDPSGRKIGELPLSRVPESGLVTGVMVDGNDVYVEKEHGTLVLIGTTDGRPADEATELSGRPSKDGTLLLTAGLSSKPQGRAYVNAFDRKAGALRFARTVLFPRPSEAIVLLDSDAKGTIYLGVAAGDPGDAYVACLDPGDGHVLGRVVLPLSHTPEEAFRDFTVGDDGTIAFAVRTEDGVQYRTATCP